MIRATLSCACVVAVAVVSNVPARADKPINLEARLAQAVMKGGEKQRNYLRVALNGCERKPTERTPVNVAFVIDRSGSMQGARIAQAREAAAAAIRRLDKNDIASVVIFDDKIELLVQAQPVDDHSAFIDRIRAGHRPRLDRDPRRRHRGRGAGARTTSTSAGSTASCCSRTARPMSARAGRRNSPSSAASCLQQGISVSTIGLGMQYNEDLMLQLARASDGNHSFVGESTDLIQVFNKEFDDVLASCAQTVSIDVELRPGVRVVRALSRDGKIEGQTAQFQINQIYAATEHYVLMEVEVDPRTAGAGDEELGRVRVELHRRAGRRTPDASRRRCGRASATRRAEVAASRDNAVAEVGDRAERARANRGGDRAARPGPARRSAGAVLSRTSRRSRAQAAAAPLSGRLQYLKQQYHGILAAPPSASAWEAAQVPAADGFEPGSAGLTVLSGGKCGSGAGGSGQRRRFSGYV